MQIANIKQISPPSMDEIIDMCKQAEQMIFLLTKRHIDHAGRLDEAMTSISNVIDNLESHKKDIERGIE